MPRIGPLALAAVASILVSCAATPVHKDSFFPTVPASDPNVTRTTDVWTVSRKGDLATCKVRLIRAGEYLVAHVDILNSGAQGPLQILSAVAWDRDKTLLKSEHSSGVSGDYEAQANQKQSAANAAGMNASMAMRDARIMAAVNNRGAWGSALTEGLAYAISSSLYASEAAALKNHADFIRMNGYMNTAIPETFSNRGLISFIISDRVPPYTLSLTLTNKEHDEKYDLTFDTLRGADFIDCPSLSDGHRREVWDSLSAQEQTAAKSKIYKMRSQWDAIRKEDPAKFDVIQWIRDYGTVGTSSHIPL